MPFVKKVKSDAYFSRFQVKYRRRREGKTDYYARKRLVVQAKNKYNAPKYRLVVRFTNKDIIVQIVYARLQGDFVLTAARSAELPRYGIQHGLTNWAAAYATGLLAARRALTKLGLADQYEGVTEPDGTLSPVEAIDEEDAPRPFKAFLDVGLKRTSTGARVFGALKGASDGGILIPHNEKRFPGYDPESKELDAEVLKKYIFGGHVAEYMESLEEEDDERFKKQFAKYLADGIGSDDIEEIYTNAHAAIRENPEFKPTEKTKDWKAETLKFNTPKLTLEQRRARIAEKIEKFKAGGFDEEEDAEDDE
ncbi:60s ribosomal protein l5-b [Macrolepiota fuliginosa MF-IS2]|uniref:60s ribosomal protein l5-b n=1 Tax=Macrolepiota fuliginosa MF-IS2 TaxID=1400762 RepID=A0A9P5XP28_9AGAR|nr:60s ribosomal protein l5-b [Macrolepiota fuliginosa MF-IS2]